MRAGSHKDLQDQMEKMNVSFIFTSQTSEKPSEGLFLCVFQVFEPDGASSQQVQAAPTWPDVKPVTAARSQCSPETFPAAWTRAGSSVPRRWKLEDWLLSITLRPKSPNLQSVQSITGSRQRHRWPELVQMFGSGRCLSAGSRTVTPNTGFAKKGAS